MTTSGKTQSSYRFGLFLLEPKFKVKVRKQKEVRMMLSATSFPTKSRSYGKI